MAEAKELVENNLISLHKADISRLHEGTLPLSDYKAAFSRLIENKELVIAELSKLKKEDLLKKLGGFSAARYKNEKKDRIVSVVWGRLLDDFVYDSVSWTHGQKYEDVIGKIVNNADQAYLDAYAAEVVAQREARAERMAKLKKSFENPETIEEFRTLIDYKGKDAISKLSAEKQELYDELVSGKTKEQRAREAAQKAIVQSVELGDTEMTLIETKHTQKGHDIYVVKLGNRVEKETYNDLNIKAKRLGGYYSSYSKGGAVAGFQFKEKSQAEKFMSLKEGDVDNLDKVIERAEDKKQKTAEKLNELGENTVEKADEKLNQDRKTNTARRARMATGIEEDALKDKQLGETLQNLGAAIAAGEATHLDGVKTKSHVELLDNLISRAKTNELREKYPEYRDYLNHKGEAPTTETVAFLREGVFPKIYKDNLQRLINDVKNKSGMKLVSARWQKRIVAADPKMDYIIPRWDKEMMELADMAYSAGLKSYDVIKNQVDTYKRLKAMGLENDSMLRSALREYIKFRGGLGQIDAVKLLERGAVGKKLGIDFFPTPSTVAMEMVQKAGVEKGMDVLEPSAGNGNIAEMIRLAGVTPDVIEISDELRKILEAKGFNLIGYDFLATDFEGRRYDRIVMNPPFSNSQDIKHVTFAYELLKPGGRIVAIMGEGAFFRSDRQATEFQNWLEETGGYNEPLPQNTFKDTNLLSTTGANARLVVIDKPIDKTSEPPVTMETAPETPELPAESGIKHPENKINDSHVGNWNEIPSPWKNTNPIKEVKYINSPYDKGLLSICKPFFGNDITRAIFSGINFDENGITVTDATKLIHLPYPNEKYSGTYATGPIKSVTGEEIKNDLFSKKYPEYAAVIPKDNINNRSKFDVYKLLQYSKVAQKFANSYTNQVTFKNGESFIAFNTEFLIEILETALKLGHKTMYSFIDAPNRGAIFTPDETYSVGKSELFLLMPVMQDGDFIGARDLDWNRQLTVYFDFADGQIHNADGSIAEFKMHYGEYELMRFEAIKILGKFKKAGDAKMIPILENFIVKDGQAIASTLSQNLIINNVSLGNGAYKVLDGAIEYDAFTNSEDYPALPDIENKVQRFVISGGIFGYYLDKALEFTGNDEMRPHMNGYFIDHKEGKTWLVATNAHILFKAEITKYIEVSGSEDFSFILSKEMLASFMDYAGEDPLVIYTTNEFTIIDTPLCRFITKNIDGKYPAYNQVIRQISPKELAINIKDLYNCIKGPEAISFLKQKRDRWEEPRIYDRLGENGKLDIYLGVWKEENREYKPVREIKICQVDYNYQEKEIHATDSVLLLMPVMMPTEGYFAFDYFFFKEILDTCSSEEISFAFSERNRAYQVDGKCFAYTQTVSSQKKAALVELPAPVKEMIPEQSNFTEIEEQIELLKETLPLLKGKSKKEVKESIDLLIESLELLKAA